MGAMTTSRSMGMYRHVRDRTRVCRGGSWRVPGFGRGSCCTSSFRRKTTCAFNRIFNIMFAYHLLNLAIIILKFFPCAILICRLFLPVFLCRDNCTCVRGKLVLYVWGRSCPKIRSLSSWIWIGILVLAGHGHWFCWRCWHRLRFFPGWVQVRWSMGRWTPWMIWRECFFSDCFPFCWKGWVYGPVAAAFRASRCTWPCSFRLGRFSCSILCVSCLFRTHRWCTRSRARQANATNLGCIWE